MNRRARQAATLGVMLSGFATIAVAQKSKGPPLTTQGSIQSNQHANKGQAVAESKRAEARANKVARAADKSSDQAERAAWKVWRSEPKSLYRGIKLTGAEKKSFKATEKRYAEERKELAKQQEAAWYAGHADPSIVSRIDALRLRERAELRGWLTPAEQLQFDRNVVALGGRK